MDSANTDASGACDANAHFIEATPTQDLHGSVHGRIGM